MREDETYLGWMDEPSSKVSIWGT